MKHERFLQSMPPLHGELIREDYWGNTVIRSIVTKSTASRMHFEKRLLPGIKIGLPDWERAHSQGKITGHESAHGIAYAPSEVNQKVQRLGVERFISELFLVKDKYNAKGDDLIIVLTTTTGTHKVSVGGVMVETHCLKEITYVIQVYNNTKKHYTTMFEATIEVDKPEYEEAAGSIKMKPSDPRVSLSVNHEISTRLLYSNNPFY